MFRLAEMCKSSPGSPVQSVQALSFSTSCTGWSFWAGSIVQSDSCWQRRVPKALCCTVGNELEGAKEKKKSFFYLSSELLFYTESFYFNSTAVLNSHKKCQHESVRKGLYMSTWHPLYTVFLAAGSCQWRQHSGSTTLLAGCLGLHTGC